MECGCGYDPSLGIDYYTERLAALMRLVSRNRSQSTYAYTKEIRRALETLVYVAWDKPDDLLRDISMSQIPGELISNALKTCFSSLLEGFLKKFHETAKDLSMGSRILLMNMLLSSIAEMGQGSLPEGGEKFLNCIFSSLKSKNEGGNM